jgi:hypothetical protein
LDRRVFYSDGRFRPAPEPSPPLPYAEPVAAFGSPSR